MILLVALTNAFPYSLCSSMPVAMVRMLGSKMTSLASKPTEGEVRMSKERLQIATLRSSSAA